MPYEGIKFKVKLESPEIPQDPRIVELKQWCQEFDQLNFTSAYPGGSNGNLSFRVKSGGNAFIITGTGLKNKTELSADSFVKVLSVNLEKQFIQHLSPGTMRKGAGLIEAEGQREPSSESMLHFAVYQARPEINAVFHGHSDEILNQTARLNLTETHQKEPYGTPELAKSVLEVLDKKNFIVIKDHGWLSLGKTMQAAGEVALAVYRQSVNISSS